MSDNRKCWECGSELVEFKADYTVFADDECKEIQEEGEQQVFCACQKCKYLYTNDGYFLRGYNICAEDYDIVLDMIETIADMKEEQFPPDNTEAVTYFAWEKITRTEYESNGVREDIEKEVAELPKKMREWQETKEKNDLESKLEFERDHKCWECGNNLTEIQCYYADVDDSNQLNIDSENFGRVFVCKKCRFIYSEDGKMFHPYYLRCGREDKGNCIDDTLAPYRTTENSFIDHIKYIAISGRMNKADYVRCGRGFIMEMRESNKSYLDSIGNTDKQIVPVPDDAQPHVVTVQPQISQAKCKYCGSTSLQAVKRGANIAGAATGFFLAGWFGALLGATSKSDGADIICLNCKKMQ